MKRRCQAAPCTRLFEGDLCPDCGADYREPDVLLDGVLVKPAPKSPHASKGTCKQAACRRCGDPTPRTRGNWQWCATCRPIVRRENLNAGNRAYRQRKRAEAATYEHFRRPVTCRTCPTVIPEPSGNQRFCPDCARMRLEDSTRRSRARARAGRVA